MQRNHVWSLGVSAIGLRFYRRQDIFLHVHRSNICQESFRHNVCLRIQPKKISMLGFFLLKFLEQGLQSILLFLILMQLHNHRFVLLQFHLYLLGQIVVQRGWCSFFPIN